MRAPRRLPRRADFVTLEGRQALTLTEDLTQRCAIDEKGTYFVSAEAWIPPTWDGRAYDLAAWTGTVATPPIRIKVKKARHARWED